MATCMNVIVILAVFSCCGISPNLAQSKSIVSFSPQNLERVCRGNNLEVNCTTNGTSLFLYAPPIINLNQGINIFSFDPDNDCSAVGTSSMVCKQSVASDNTSFVGVLTLNVPNGQEIGNYILFCNGSDAQVSTDFEVLAGADYPNQEMLSPNLGINGNSENCIVNMTWNYLRNAEEYKVIIESPMSITLTTNNNFYILDYQCANFTGTIKAINTCGWESNTENFNMSICDSQCIKGDASRDDNGGDTTTIIVGVVLGVILIITLVALTSVSIALCLKNRDP